MLNVTGSVNPPIAETAITAVFEVPALIANELGDAEIAKSGAVGTAKSVPMGLPMPVDKS